MTSPCEPLLGADQLLDALDPEQRAVASALHGPVRVLAGAGTGKTRAITHRIAYGVASGVYNPQEVLAVTFTTRAAGEMRTRLRGLGAGGVQARTFHSAALRQARFFWPKVYGGELPVLIESKLGLIGNAARRNRVQTDQATLRDLASEVEWAKVSNVRPDDYPRIAEARGRSVTGQDPATVARVFATYEDVKRDQGRMDMEDVLLCAAALLSEDERVAAQVRRQYKWFVVDEFQDVSPIQAALLDLWLGGREDLCVVGDPAQTIYSFAGANSSYLLDFPQRHQGTTSVELVRNYRSTPQVVNAANRLLAGSSSAGVQLRSQQESGAEVRFAEHSDEVAEAEQVAADIKAMMDAGTPAREIAVLFRINAQSEAFEEAFAARSVPYVLRGAARFFERAEVKQAVTLLRGNARSGEGSGDGLVGDVRAVLVRHGLGRQGADRPRQRPRQVGVAAGDRLAGRGAGDRPARGRAGRLRRRARPARHRAARARRRGRHPRDAARRQGSRVGRRLRGRHARGHDADHLRRGPGRRRGGAPAALRRHDPRPSAAHGLVGAGPHTWGALHPQAVAVPDRAPAADRLGHRARARVVEPQAQGRRALPRVRQAARQHRGAQGRAGARTARRPTTRRCSSASGPGASSVQVWRRCRPTSCSPTSPCRRSPR